MKSNKFNNKSIQNKSFKLNLKELNLEKNEVLWYPSVFNNLDDGGDIIVKGAFAKTIRENFDRMKVFFWHGQDRHEAPIGKPLEMVEDDFGLLVRAKISDTERGREVLQLLKDGVITEGSIGYQIVKDEWTKDGHIIREVKLMEVSFVPWGMNSATKVLAVKGKNAEGKDNSEPLEEKQPQTWGEIYQIRNLLESYGLMISSLRESIDEIVWNWGEPIPEDEGKALLQQNINQFASAMMGWVEEMYSAGLLKNDPFIIKIKESMPDFKQKLIESLSDEEPETAKTDISTPETKADSVSDVKEPESESFPTLAKDDAGKIEMELLGAKLQNSITEMTNRLNRISEKLK
ncbi:MAG TPA: HK97 family phage prohead protease [Clostridia bacterium]|nr:HK97 family phage prohead protease [Clostridia bacterium]